jgi:L-iditol 2-dehydrogenase
MKAVRLVAPRQFEFLDIEPPSLKPGESIVKMEYLSICGSDLRTYDRVLPEESYPFRIGAPIHECVGVVEETTSDDLRRGQRVIAVTNAGGMVEYAAVPSNLLVPVPEDGHDQALWVLCQPVGTVIYSVQQMGSMLGKRVVVLGQGPIGLSFTDLLVRQGARQVIVTDLLDYRLEVAKKLGATHTINASREDVAERVKQITGEAMADAAVDACGRPEVAHQVFEVIRRQGLVVIFGMAHTEDVFPFNWGAMYSKVPRMVVTNSAVSGDRVDCVKTCVDLVSQGRMDFSYMLSHKLSWIDVNRAFELYSAKKDNSLKVVMSVG